MNNYPNVAILLATYNGEKYLECQIDSIFNQIEVNCTLFISDDSSQDKTVDIIKKYQKEFGIVNIILLDGPQKGHCANFLSLIERIPDDYDYYAYCDQDDYWKPDKLKSAIKILNSPEFYISKIPLLYCGRTDYVDNKLNYITKSPLFKYPPSFRNSIVQNIAGGNTMVFNVIAKINIKKSIFKNLITHDWWTYIVISACGGKVYYDPNSYVLYRQHSESIISGNYKLSSKLNNIIDLFKGKNNSWNTVHVQALLNIFDMLTFDNKSILLTFIKMRNSSIKHRFRMVEVCGLYRQTFKGTVMLYLAILINKI